MQHVFDPASLARVFDLLGDVIRDHFWIQITGIVSANLIALVKALRPSKRRLG
jgi:hypothetical protein